ncbi:hypothetical protein E2N92_02040 [Methanofollis formosanus]|uniref:Uncharacterized protein n=1 Tax=Methanofollis formosanus TaxID=299308 RepID=A0A8G1A0R4_9EURY|nr:hypothetical protein [Methanofollis formosanus]QYZ78296.1 hypothetical protein E2N92_02040 [Methanofollis formosanus]
MHLVSACLLLISLVAAVAAGAVMGEEVELMGTATEGETVYLFFTGPNLPAGGVNLENAATVETGNPDTFTTVTADDKGRWRYRWKTAGLGIDPGTYTVYASDHPAARDDLSASGAVYSMLSVTLRRPGLFLETGEEERTETEKQETPEDLEPEPREPGEQETPTTRAAPSIIGVAAALALLIRRCV